MHNRNAQSQNATKESFVILIKASSSLKPSIEKRLNQYRKYFNNFSLRSTNGIIYIEAIPTKDQHDKLLQVIKTEFTFDPSQIKTGKITSMNDGSVIQITGPQKILQDIRYSFLANKGEQWHTFDHYQLHLIDGALFFTPLKTVDINNQEMLIAILDLQYDLKITAQSSNLTDPITLAYQAPQQINLIPGLSTFLQNTRLVLPRTLQNHSIFAASISMSPSVITDISEQQINEVPTSQNNLTLREDSEMQSLPVVNDPIFNTDEWKSIEEQFAPAHNVPTQSADLNEPYDAELKKLEDELNKPTEPLTNLFSQDELDQALGRNFKRTYKIVVKGNDRIRQAIVSGLRDHTGHLKPFQNYSARSVAGIVFIEGKQSIAENNALINHLKAKFYLDESDIKIVEIKNENDSNEIHIKSNDHDLLENIRESFSQSLGFWKEFSHYKVYLTPGMIRFVPQPTANINNRDMLVAILEFRFGLKVTKQPPELATEPNQPITMTHTPVKSTPSNGVSIAEYIKRPDVQALLNKNVKRPAEETEHPMRKRR